MQNGTILELLPIIARGLPCTPCHAFWPRLRLDAGTHEPLLDSSQFIHTRQAGKSLAPRKFSQGFINAEQLLRLAEP